MVDTRFPVSIHILTVLAHYQPKLVSSEQLAVSVKTNPYAVKRAASALRKAPRTSDLTKSTAPSRITV